MNINLKKYIFTAAATIILGLGGFYWHTRSQPFPDVLTLDAGPFQRVLFIPDDTENNVFAYLVFPYGEARNPMAQGLLHYVEHLAYTNLTLGDDKRPVHSNAWTNLHTTGYWTMAPAQSLAANLRSLISVADPLQAADDFAASERDIIVREYEYRVAEQALYPIQRGMTRLLHDDGPLGRSVIGDRDEITSYTLQMAVALHEQSHRLSDATLLIYGNISKASVQAAMSALRNKAGQASEPGPIKYDPIEPMMDRQAMLVDQTLAPTFLVKSLVPVTPCEVAVDCEVARTLARNSLDSALPGGLAGPLRYSEFIARRFSFSMDFAAPDRVSIAFSANPDQGVSLAQLDDAFFAIWSDRLVNGLPEATIEQKRRRLMTDLDAILPNDRAKAQFRHVLDRLAANRPLYDLNDWYRSMANISPKQVNEFLRSLNTSNRTVVRHIHNKEKTP